MSRKTLSPRSTILDLFEIADLREYDRIVAKLSTGFDVDTKDSGGRTLLMEAAVERDRKLMEFLIENGANVNVQDNRSWTALHFAAQNSDNEALALLLSNGGDVTKRDDNGNSIISTAVLNSKGDCAVIKLLLSYGAAPKVENKKGISALSLANLISNYDLRACFDHNENTD